MSFIEIEMGKEATFTASASSDVPLTATVGNKTLASISKENDTFTVTGLMPGTTNVKLTQAGSGNYEAAETFVINVSILPPDGIQNAIATDDAEVYDLLGRKVSDTSKLKGIYIVNGRKTIF